MGGRGSYSFVTAKARIVTEKRPATITRLAAGQINSGAAAGTTLESGVERFRKFTVKDTVENSAFIDEYGYVHTLLTMNNPEQTIVVPADAVRNERGIVGVIHNHPADKERLYGGTVSNADVHVLLDKATETNGKIHKIFATAQEGVYEVDISRFTIPKTRRQQITARGRITRAMKKALKESAYDGKGRIRKYSSKKKKWGTLHENVKQELEKLGMKVTFTPSNARGQDMIKAAIGILS